MRRLAAGRRTQVNDCFAADISEKSGRQGGGGILHPPVPSLKPGQLGDGALWLQAQGASRQYLGPQGFGQRPGIGLGAQVEGRLIQMGFGDGARRLFPIGLVPRPPQPFRCVEAGRVLVLHKAGAFPGKPPQDRIDQPLMGAVAPLLGQADHGVDGGVRWRFQEQQLADTET